MCGWKSSGSTWLGERCHSFIITGGLLAISHRFGGILISRQSRILWLPIELGFGICGHHTVGKRIGEDTRVTGVILIIFVSMNEGIQINRAHTTTWTQCIDLLPLESPLDQQSDVWRKGAEASIYPYPTSSQREGSASRSGYHLMAGGTIPVASRLS